MASVMEGMRKHDDKKDHQRALNTLRYIHANPKSAGRSGGMFYDFSNYGTYDRLTDDGLTQWHPQFLALGQTLEECARKYRGFCRLPALDFLIPAKWGSCTSRNPRQGINSHSE